jgi:hypothetical protein
MVEQHSAILQNSDPITISISKHTEFQNFNYESLENVILDAFPNANIMYSPIPHPEIVWCEHPSKEFQSFVKAVDLTHPKFFNHITDEIDKALKINMGNVIFNLEQFHGQRLNDQTVKRLQTECVQVLETFQSDLIRQFPDL